MKSIISWLLFVIVIMVGVIYGLPALLSQILGTEEPMMTVTSESMWPELTRGDLIFTRKADLSEIQVGTVLIFHHANGMAIHRVVRIKESTITTRGDANSAEDSPITYADVAGQAVIIGDRILKIPLVGKMALIMNPSQTQVTVDGQSLPEDNLPVQKIVRYLTSPVGILLAALTVVILFEEPIRGIYFQLFPGSVREQRLRVMRRKMMIRWGETRTRRIMKI